MSWLAPFDFVGLNLRKHRRGGVQHGQRARGPDGGGDGDEGEAGEEGHGGLHLVCLVRHSAVPMNRPYGLVPRIAVTLVTQMTSARSPSILR
jgi:hypothetical protein